MKQVPQQEPDLVSLSVRVDRATAELLKGIADREYRPVAAEMRRIIENHVALNTIVSVDGERRVAGKAAA